MKILVIPTNDWIRAPGHGHIDFIAEKLAEKGHEVYAWHFDLYRNNEIKRNPRKVKLLKSRTIWVRDPASFYLLNALLQATTFFKVIRELKIDVIINENILPGLIAFLVSPAKVLKVFDLSDYFPESASIQYESLPVLRKIVEAVVLWVTKLNIKFADICLAVCRSLIKTIKKVDNAKVCYLLTNGVDTSKFSFTKNDDRRSKGLNRFNDVIVMGVIDSWLDLITPLKALRILKEKIPNVRFVVIGPWRKTKFKDYIQNFIQTNDLQPYVKITGYVSDRKLAQYLEHAICCLMPYNTNSFGSAIRLPEKLFIYSACGKPILSTPLPEVIALRCEHVFFYHDVDELVSMVSLLMLNTNLRANLPLKAYEFARKHDVNVLAEELEQILLNSH